MKKVIRWEDPPAAKGPGLGAAWGPVADALRARPGEWALIEEGAPATTTANHVSHGKIAAFRPPGSFEAVARSRGRDSIGQRQHDIYARFVGAES